MTRYILIMIVLMATIVGLQIYDRVKFRETVLSTAETKVNDASKNPSKNAVNTPEKTFPPLFRFEVKNEPVGGEPTQKRITQLKAEADNLSKDYLKTLEDLISDKIYMDVKVYQKMNFVTEEVEVIAYQNFTAHFANSYIPMSESYENEIAESKKQRGHVRISAKRLGIKADDVVRMKYAVFLVTEIGEQRWELPIVMPVEIDGRFTEENGCQNATPLNEGDGDGNFYLCFNWFMNGMALPENQHIAAKTSYPYQEGLRHTLKPGEKASVNSWFEIRQLF